MMCGIAGFAGLLPADPISLLRDMCDSIRHRGPDEDGYAWDGTVGIGMRRLSIIDLQGGRQPISNETGTVAVVFNGEIYNHRELRQELISQGHRFSTHTDTEVLVHLYEEHGDALVRRLRGMFAFALWDSAGRRLLMARDRLGKKPLYYTQRGRALAFGSELKVLTRTGLASGEPAPGAVARYLALGYVPDPYTIFEGVLKLPPAHTLVWTEDGHVELDCYWRPPAEADAAIDEHIAVEEVRRLFSESVACRMVADVPVGAFLSGGIDSAAVVAEMVRQSDRPIDTYTIGFREHGFNEAPAAAETARLLGTRHHELVITPDIDDLIDRIVLAFDEPFADSSALPTYMVSQFAAADLKVVLSGDGGDELFGGYTRYLDWARRNRGIPRVVRAWSRHLALALPHGAYGRNRMLELSRSAHGRYTGMVADPLAVAEGGVAADAVENQIAWDTSLLGDAFRQAGGRDPLGQLLHVDLLTYLPGDILVKVDRMSMAASLEARAPLLDHELVEFAFRIPTALKFKDGKGKHILRQALTGMVPDEVMRRPKSGFGLPLIDWINRELRYRAEALLDPNNPISAFVDTAAVRRVLEQHYRGRRDHSPLIWKLVVLSIWLGNQSLAASDVTALSTEWAGVA